MQARRKQTPVAIRSDRAAARLRLLTRDGRSQAQVIEEALDKLPLPKRSEAELDAWWADFKVLIDEIPKGSIMTMKEFDALEYDENGDLRDR